MTPRKAGLLLVGGAIAMAIAERMSKPKDPGKATPIFVPDMPVTPTGHVQVPGMATQPAVPQGPVPLAIGSSVQPLPGKFYRVTVTVDFPLSMAASVSKVQSQAESHGFANVSVTHNQKPAGWPGRLDGNYYVTGTYTGQPTSLDTSYVGGQVKIIEVWQG